MKSMNASERIGMSLPDGLDKETYDEERRQCAINALAVGFRDTVQKRDSTDNNIDHIVYNMTIKNINDLFYEEKDRFNRCYIDIIDEFLAHSDRYEAESDYIVEGYLDIVQSLRDRVRELQLDGKTDESSSQYKTSTASHLDTRLTSICERTQLVVSAYSEFKELKSYIKNITDHVNELDSTLQNDMAKRVNELDSTLQNDIAKRVDKLDATLQDLNAEIYTGTEKENEQKKPGLKEAVNQLSHKISNIDSASDKIMPNIITLLGIFSSVIVVILSLITTSSTWLSNANNTSILIAFVVPAGIITIAICGLTALVRSLVESLLNSNKEQDSKQNPTEEAKGNKAQGKHPLLQKWGVWLVVVGASFAITIGTIVYCQLKNDEKMHYIIKCVPTSEAKDDTDNEPTPSLSDTTGQELFIVQEVILPSGDVSLNKIFCDEDDKHEDGLVYYCLLHEEFE